MAEISHEVGIVAAFGRNADKRVVVHPSHMVDEVAQLAAIFIQEWGKVPFTASNYEDAAGRQKIENASRVALVSEAFDVAEAFQAMAFERGHMIPFPTEFFDKESA